MITGFWVGTDQYRMYDARSHTTWLVMIPGAEYLDENEVADMVDEAREEFTEQVKERPDHQAMPRSQQNELAPHLREIEASKWRFREVGHGKYWPQE